MQVDPDFDDSDYNIARADNGATEWAERSMWCTVLLQQLIDFTGTRTKRKEAAQKYLLEGSADLSEVCERAGFNVGDVTHCARLALEDEMLYNILKVRVRHARRKLQKMPVECGLFSL